MTERLISGQDFNLLVRWFGIKRQDIADVLGIAAKTLDLHYNKEVLPPTYLRKLSELVKVPENELIAELDRIPKSESDQIMKLDGRRKWTLPYS